VLPDLALCLRDTALQDAAHAAMWVVFTRSRDPAVNELMAEAEPLLHGGAAPQLERALLVYGHVVRLAPSYAEVGSTVGPCASLLVCVFNTDCFAVVCVQR
jgi:hypothetical protein